MGGKEAVWLAAFTSAIVDADDTTDPTAEVLGAVMAALPAVDGAALTGVRAGGPYTVAVRGDSADRVEATQRRVGQGPTLQACRELGVLGSADLTVDARWPNLQAVAPRLPARAVLCCPLLHALPGKRPAVLTLYGSAAGALDDLDPDLLSLVLVSADLALAGLAQRGRARNLERALGSNERIGVAIGVLVGLHHYTEDDAHQVMAVASQALNRKLHDIAAEVVLTGAVPKV